MPSIFLKKLNNQKTDHDFVEKQPNTLKFSKSTFKIETMVVYKNNNNNKDWKHGLGMENHDLYKPTFLYFSGTIF